MIKLMSKEEIKSFWHFNKQQKEDMLEKFITELPTLRAKVGIFQEDIANTIGISRQTYGAYENGDRRCHGAYISLYLFILIISQRHIVLFIF